MNHRTRQEFCRVCGATECFVFCPHTHKIICKYCEARNRCSVCNKVGCVETQTENGMIVCRSCGNAQYNPVVASEPEARAAVEHDEEQRQGSRSVKRSHSSIQEIAAAAAERAVVSVSSTRPRKRAHLADYVTAEERANRHRVETPEGIIKNTKFIEKAIRTITVICSDKLFGSNIYSDGDDSLRSFYTPGHRQFIYENAVCYPKALWSLLQRAMRAHAYGAASVYIAALRGNIPCSIWHVCTILCAHEDTLGLKNLGNVEENVIPMVENCVFSLTSDARFPELRVPYERCVLHEAVTIAALPRPPKALHFTPRNGRTEPKLTGVALRLSKMTTEERIALTTKVSVRRDRLAIFAKETTHVWQRFLLRDEQLLSRARQVMANAKRRKTKLSEEDSLFVERITAYHFTSKHRRTRMMAGSSRGLFTASAPRMGAALFKFVVSSPGGVDTYAIIPEGETLKKREYFNWGYMHFKVCQCVRQASHIRWVLSMFDEVDIGVKLRNTLLQQEERQSSAAAAPPPQPEPMEIEEEE